MSTASRTPLTNCPLRAVLNEFYCFIHGNFGGDLFEVHKLANCHPEDKPVQNCDSCEIPIVDLIPDDQVYLNGMADCLDDETFGKIVGGLIVFQRSQDTGDNMVDRIASDLESVQSLDDFFSDYSSSHSPSFRRNSMSTVDTSPQGDSGT